ncbi:MAG: hypothetical protein KAU12_04145 [Candidatus Omnitrophica bacterium]|nr:hypothetical protein [Candidatus Omnitrophota bacterium]
MKKWFLNNPGLKITALILAVFLWFYISMEVTARYKIKRKEIEGVRVDILRRKGEIILGPFMVGLDPEKVNLSIEGPREKLENIGTDKIIAFVDITNIEKEGIYLLPVKVILPDKLRLSFQNPGCTVELTMRKAVE